MEGDGGGGGGQEDWVRMMERRSRGGLIPGARSLYLARNFWRIVPRRQRSSQAGWIARAPRGRAVALPKPPSRGHRGPPPARPEARPHRIYRHCGRLAARHGASRNLVPFRGADCGTRGGDRLGWKARRGARLQPSPPSRAARAGQGRLPRAAREARCTCIWKREMRGDARNWPRELARLQGHLTPWMRGGRGKTIWRKRRGAPVRPGRQVPRGSPAAGPRGAACAARRRSREGCRPRAQERPRKVRYRSVPCRRRGARAVARAARRLALSGVARPRCAATRGNERATCMASQALARQADAAICARAVPDPGKCVARVVRGDFAQGQPI